MWADSFVCCSISNNVLTYNAKTDKNDDMTGVKAIAEALSVSSSMKSVNVSGNPIGDEGKAILSNAAEARGMVLQMDDYDLSDY